ncbi:hypothetical protein COM02_06390 [Bacillus toyonensis]|nr:hypothetical protein COM02_06390 [Bacillus toyonensis]
MQCIECFPVRRCVHFGNALFCYYEQQCTVKPCATIPKFPIEIPHQGPGGIGPIVMSSNSPAIMSYSTGPSCFARCMQINRR